MDDAIITCWSSGGYFVSCGSDEYGNGRADVSWSIIFCDTGVFSAFADVLPYFSLSSCRRSDRCALRTYPGTDSIVFSYT